jgi:hypothetical protein
MGLKSLTVSGLSFFGMRAMIDELMLERSMLWLLKSLKNLMKSSLMKAQHFFNEKPIKTIWA